MCADARWLFAGRHHVFEKEIDAPIVFGNKAQRIGTALCSKHYRRFSINSHEAKARGSSADTKGGGRNTVRRSGAGQGRLRNRAIPEQVVGTGRNSGLTSARSATAAVREEKSEMAGLPQTTALHLLLRIRSDRPPAFQPAQDPGPENETPENPARTRRRGDSLEAPDGCPPESEGRNLRWSA